MIADPPLDLSPIKKKAQELADPCTFIETFLSFKGQRFSLYPYQREIVNGVNLLKDRAVIRKGRQVGGSLVAAAMLVYWGFTHRDCTFLIVSKTREQSGFIASYVRRFFDSHHVLRNSIDPRKSVKGCLTLKNGTRFFDRTVGHESANLRGISLEGKGALVHDESAYLSDASIENLMHVCHGGGELHCSTPRMPRGFFYRACHSPDYKQFLIPATICPRISKDDIERLRRLLKPSEYQTDILANFAAGENNVFDQKAIENAVDPSIPLFDANSFSFDKLTPQPNRNFIYSLDPSLIGIDKWALTIGELDAQANTMRVIAYHAWASKEHYSNQEINATLTNDPRTITDDIINYSKIFPCTKMYVDSTANPYFGQTLLNNHLLPVEDVIWSASGKQRMIEHLSTCFRAKRITIPNDSEMVGQLLDFAYNTKLMEDNSDRMIYLSGQDDYVASLAMLAKSIAGDPVYSKCDYFFVR